MTFRPKSLKNLLAKTSVLNLGQKNGMTKMILLTRNAEKHVIDELLKCILDSSQKGSETKVRTLEITYSII